jgi:argininosuccinate lyase
MTQLWISRFDSSVSEQTLHFTETTNIDRRFVRHDIWGSVGHVLMLLKTDLVAIDDGRAILKVLLDLLEEERTTGVPLKVEHEDVHLNIEARIIGVLGVDIGGRVHTARSRNDQVVTDLRLYLREQILDAYYGTIELIQVVLKRARTDGALVIAGYTHSQAAQPITVGFWLSAYASILLRDCSRLQAAFRNTNLNPLGACALAGTSFNIDRRYTTELLAFDGVLEHALDATSSRDFAIDFAAALASVMATLSRLAEELVWWSSQEFRLLDVGDAFCTGSSIMPQKRNPVVAELTRARAAVVFGGLAELLAVVKGLPLGYSCDLQQDKPPLWRILDVTLPTLAIMAAQMKELRVDADRATPTLWQGFTTATELANELVRRYRIAFREAYSVTGQLVKLLSANSRDFRDTATVQQFLRESGYEIGADELEAILDPAQCVRAQRSQGSTNPDCVSDMLLRAETELQLHATFVAAQRDRIEAAFDQSVALARGYASADDRHEERV